MTITLVDVRLDHQAGGTPLVTHANLSVARGEVVLIVGAAGVGTSRVVAAALGELPAREGRIEVLGRDVGRLRRSSLRLLRRRVGIVPQELCLLDDRSAMLNVVLPLEIDGVPRAVSVARATGILARLGLEAQASLPIDCLSASARQRVAVARALVREPELLIADHPTSMQDAEGAELVCAAIALAAKQGAACLVLGRDPALRVIAEREQWRQLVMVDGALTPMSEIQLDGTTMEELIVGIESAPVRAAPRPIEPELTPDNIVPFPTAVGAR
ncbi:MAG: ATP-binding cassette domain-containing protein [Proteobacteria bacterium]|nr:ATP-binding cassette domain-containing protein [Pseudomonadota bacterium]